MHCVPFMHRGSIRERVISRVMRRARLSVTCSRLNILRGTTSRRRIGHRRITYEAISGRTDLVVPLIHAKFSPPHDAFVVVFPWKLCLPPPLPSKNGASRDYVRPRHPFVFFRSTGQKKIGSRLLLGSGPISSLFGTWFLSISRRFPICIRRGS